MKSLRSFAVNRDTGEQELLAIAGALKESKGLVDLQLRYDFKTSDETWDAIYDSLETHPALEVLELCSLDANAPLLAPSMNTSRIQALVDMLKGNTSIHDTIRVKDCYSEYELYRKSVILISSRASSGRAFLPSKKDAQLRTCWAKRFLLYEPM
jgi:hypothetical protein